MMLAKAMKGRVEFESEPGEGTTVRVFLPRALDDEAAAEAVPVVDDVADAAEDKASVKADAGVTGTQSKAWTAPGDVWLPGPDAEVPDVEGVVGKSVSDKASDTILTDTPAESEDLPETTQSEIPLPEIPLTEAERVVGGIRQRLTKAKVASAKDRVAQSRKPKRNIRRSPQNK
jgi:hypothetical protein